MAGCQVGEQAFAAGEGDGLGVRGEDAPGFLRRGIGEGCYEVVDGWKLGTCATGAEEIASDGSASVRMWGGEEITSDGSASVRMWLISRSL